MPIEPISPPDSKVWRILHRPLTLIIVAMILVLVAELAMNALVFGVQLFGHVPGGRYIVALFCGMAIVVAYWVFVRIIERRSVVEELGADGVLGELIFGFGSGVGLALISLTVLNLLGAISIVGFIKPQAMMFSFIVALSEALMLEIVLRGFIFRQVERFLGSWLTLLGAAIAYGGLPILLGNNVVPLALLADAVNAGLMFAAMYMVTRRLWAPIGLHAAWIVAQSSLVTTPMTAGQLSGLLLFDVSGPAWMTGGNIGWYASVPAILVSAVFVTYLLVSAVRRHHVVRPAWQRSLIASGLSAQL